MITARAMRQFREGWHLGRSVNRRERMGPSSLTMPRAMAYGYLRGLYRWRK